MPVRLKSEANMSTERPLRTALVKTGWVVSGGAIYELVRIGVFHRGVGIDAVITTGVAAVLVFFIVFALSQRRDRPSRDQHNQS